jgi:FkbM family methyltransferase
MAFLDTALELLAEIDSDYRELTELVHKNRCADPEIEQWWSHFSCVWDELMRQVGWPPEAPKQSSLFLNVRRAIRTIRRRRRRVAPIAFSSPIFGASQPIGMPFHPSFSVIPTAYGFKLCATGRDMWHPLATGHYSVELSETLITVRLAAHTECFVDVGANIGFFSFLFASEASPYSIVLACEPSKENANLILAGIKENGWGEKIHLLIQAVGERTGTALLHLNTLGSGGNTVVDVHHASFRKVMGSSSAVFPNVETVPITTLDEISRAHVQGRRTLVKIDVEGYEKQVLTGANSWLSDATAPILLYEAWPNSSLSARGRNHIEVARMLEEFDYRIWRVQAPRHGEALVAEYDSDKASQASETGNYLAIPKACSGLEEQLPQMDVRVFGDISRLRDLRRFSQSCLETIRTRIHQ